MNKDALLAQLVEHLTLNQGVRGSSPRRRTIIVTGFSMCLLKPVIFCLDNKGLTDILCIRSNWILYKCFLLMVVTGGYTRISWHFQTVSAVHPVLNGRIHNASE